MNIYDNINFQGALFDMDGLVLDTEKIYHRELKKAGKFFGYDISDEIICGAMGLCGTASSDYFYSIFGYDFPFDKIHNKKTQLLDKYFDKNPPKIKTGFKRLISYLKRNDKKTALATSTKRETAKRYLQQAGIFNAFDEIVCGDEINNSKPNPEIFITAAKKINIDIKDCIIFEDSFNGIRAAAAAGGKPIMVPDTIKPTEEIKSLCFRIQKTLWTL